LYCAHEKYETWGDFMREWTSGITESLNRKCRVARAAFNQTDASVVNGVGGGRGRVPTAEENRVRAARQFIDDEAIEDRRFQIDDDEFDDNGNGNNSSSSLESLPDFNAPFTQNFDDEIID
jgi:hypothetical protein